MKVRYWWTADGDAEICERTEVVLEEETECYHCLRQIPKGERAIWLISDKDQDNYIICSACDKQGTQVM